MINIEEFRKVELRTAKVLQVDPHPNADRLWVIQLELGAEKRQIVAGIRQHYTPEQLVGKTIICAANLEPAMLRGVESQGMLLAVRGAARVLPLGVDGEVATGTRVT
jgi:methionyl-tRNA synthetase